MDEKKLLSVVEAARKLGIGRSHFYRFVLRGDIESVKLGKSRKIPPDALDAFIERLREEQRSVS